MEKNEEFIIDKICKEQNFEELLLEIKGKIKSNTINRILTNISENEKLDEKLKRAIYEDFYDYLKEINEEYIANLKYVFILGAKKAFEEINRGKEDAKMENTIKVIIADDNIHICKFIKHYLSQHEDIEILGEAHTDEEEIRMIEELKPDIVITDLMRNHKYTGLDIIRNYFEMKSNVKFLVISADDKATVINNGLEVAGYIKKPFTNYEIIYDELVRINNILNNN